MLTLTHPTRPFLSGSRRPSPRPHPAARLQKAEAEPWLAEVQAQLVSWAQRRDALRARAAEQGVHLAMLVDPARTFLTWLPVGRAREGRGLSGAQLVLLVAPEGVPVEPGDRLYLAPLGTDGCPREGALLDFTAPAFVQRLTPQQAGLLAWGALESGRVLHATPAGPLLVA